MSIQSCPGEDELLAFAGGFVSGAAARALEAHLDGCARCYALCELARSRDTADVPPPATDGVLVPGDDLGRYRILALIGQGAMGRVYAAHDPELDRRVAIKVLRHPADDLRARLRREAKAMARLSHPNLVAVHDVGEVGDVTFIAMEHVDGTTLARWLGERPRATADVLARFTDAGRGLAAAHHAGVVHRDFKPDNVLVDRGGRVRVTDFGLAQVEVVPPGHGDATDPGDPYATAPRGRVGTPAYMAPEQLAGLAVDARADVFAFAVSLWEALAGAPPFPLAGLTERAQAIAAGRVLEPPAGRIPRGAVRALRRAMAARPADRPALDELLAAVAPRRRAAPLAIGLAALAAAAIVAVILLRSHPAPRPAAHELVRRRVVAAGGAAAVDHAALSPDGALAAYADFHGALHVIDLAGGATRDLPVSGPVAGVVWLPGGVGALVCAPRAAGCWLEVVPPSGVLPAPADRPPAVAHLPRGKLLAVAGDRIAVLAGSQITLASIQGRDLGAIPVGSRGARLDDGAAAPGGRRLAVYDSVARTIDLVDVDRAATTGQLAIDGAFAGVAWPSERRLVYGVVEARVLTHLYEVALDGAGAIASPPRRLDTLDGPIELVGATAGRLAYIHRARQVESYVAPLYGDALGMPTRLTDDLFDDTVGAWTPDGRALVVNSIRDGRSTIALAPAGGGSLTVLADGDKPTIAGDQILFLRRRATAAGVAWTLHAVPLAGGPVRDLLALGEEPAGVGLALQCVRARCVVGAVTDVSTRLRWLDRASGRQDPIAGAPDGPTWTFALAPAGDRLALAPDRAHLDVIDTATGARRPLADEACQLHRMAWSPDGRALYASCLEPTLSPSYLVRYRDGARAVIAQTPFVFTRLAVSPDGSRLAYTITDVGGSLWIADGL